MSIGWAMVDGGPMVPLDEARIPVTDPGFTHGWTVFETLLAQGCAPPSFVEHLDRLAHSCEQACLAMPSRDTLLAEVEDIVRRFDTAVRVRITLTGGGHRVVQGSPADARRLHRPIRAVRGVHRDEPFLGGAVKHGSRAPWMVALQCSGADEVLLVDAEGRFTEGTSCGVLAVVHGTLWTAAHDHRILPSTTVNDLVRRATALGIGVRREGPIATGPWDALYIASVTRDIAPVVELDGQALPGWEPVGLALRDAREEGRAT
ncbi:MAG: aminotransferase class IV [Deltaproteobacteria bacterium]|nr:aminotransferase class IV [Deltaproteobacteria bacterium]MBW2255574.1 aminotransferase class IV [Deltaproteobacteria bacterium]